MGCTSVNKEHVYVLIETELGDIKVKLYNETPLQFCQIGKRRLL